MRVSISNNLSINLYYCCTLKRTVQKYPKGNVLSAILFVNILCRGLTQLSDNNCWSTFCYVKLYKNKMLKENLLPYKVVFLFCFVSFFFFFLTKQHYYVLLCNHEYFHCLNHRQTKNYIIRRNQEREKTIIWKKALPVSNNGFGSFWFGMVLVGHGFINYCLASESFVVSFS